MSSAAAAGADPGGPKKVFISYRRDDNRMTVTVLQKALRDRPDIAKVFRDIDEIEYGDDFAAVIDEALHAADVVLVIVGPRWSELLQARLTGVDWVRHEVAQALRLRAASLADPAGTQPLRVIPVLIGGATPPAEDQVPAEIAPRARARVGRPHCCRPRQLEAILSSARGVQAASSLAVLGAPRKSLSTGIDFAAR